MEFDTHGAHTVRDKKTATRWRDPRGARRSTPGPHASPAQPLVVLSGQRRKLLELFYADKISAYGFKEEEEEEEDRLCAAIEAARAQADEANSETRTQNDLERRFDAVIRILSNLDVEAVWKAAEDRERRVLVEKLVRVGDGLS